MVRTAFVVAALGLAVPAHAAAPITPAEKAAITKAFGGVLRDGVSARWRWLPPAEGNVITYCGFVNSKNAYGAYVGFQPFMVSLVRRNAMVFSPMTGSEDSDDGAIARRMCADKGYDISEVPSG